MSSSGRAQRSSSRSTSSSRPQARITTGGRRRDDEPGAGTRGRRRSRRPLEKDADTSRPARGRRDDEQSSSRSPKAPRENDTYMPRPRPERVKNTDADSADQIADNNFADFDDTVTFADLGLADPLVKALRKQGFTNPFPIQQATIRDVLAGKDVMGRGPTGSGKTFAFGLPILHILSHTGASRPGHPRAVILQPTRELAAQVADRLADIAAAAGLRVIAIYGGVNIKRDITALAAPVDVLVATPGRAQDLIDQKKLSFKDVAITCLDEADQMADMGFLPQVKKLMALCPAKGQRLLFSATLDGDVDVLVKKFMHNPVTHSTAPVQAAVDTMTHYRLLVGETSADRTAVSQWIAARGERTIMFMRTRYGVDAQVRKLRRVGINAIGIHGDKGQNSRQHAIESFTNGEIPVLVATDIAARGIDIADVSLVVHVEPPAEHKAYVHRSGRTARGGKEGTSVTLVLDNQRDDVDKLMRKAGVHAPEVKVAPGSAELARITGAQQPSDKQLEGSTRNRGGGNRGGGNARRGAAPRGEKTPATRSRRGRPSGRR